MTTPDPRCKPPANNIIEPLTFTTGEMALRGKMVLSQSDFLHLASKSMFSINNYMYEKNQVTHKKRENMRNAGVKRVFGEPLDLNVNRTDLIWL